MLIARHRRTKMIAVEAFEVGIGVPLIRHANGRWQPGAVSAEELFDQFEDITYDLDDVRDIIGRAKQVWDVFARTLGSAPIERMTVDDVCAFLRAKIGRDTVDEASPSVADARHVSQHERIPPQDYVPVHLMAASITHRSH